MSFSLLQEEVKLQTKKLLMVSILIVGLGFGAETTFAACKRPDAPVLPDADTAALAQMIKAKKEVKAYMAVAKAYLKCVRSDSKHDRVVDAMGKIAKNFNLVVKAYKSRVKR